VKARRTAAIVVCGPVSVNLVVAAGKRGQNRLFPGIDGLTARLVARFVLISCRCHRDAVTSSGGCVLPLTLDSLAKPFL
jgi:hypothetical protein